MPTKTTSRATPRQHDVFLNPDVRSRKSFPFIAVLQADVADGDRRIVAPLALRGTPDAAPQSRGVPAVTCAGRELVLVLSLMGTAALGRLRTEPVGSLAAYRDDITRALDWLFFGI